MQCKRIYLNQTRSNLDHFHWLKNIFWDTMMRKNSFKLAMKFKTKSYSSNKALWVTVHQKLTKNIWTKSFKYLILVIWLMNWRNKHRNQEILIVCSNSLKDYIICIKKEKIVNKNGRKSIHIWQRFVILSKRKRSNKLEKINYNHMY